MGMAIIDGVYLVGQIIEVNYTNSRALLLSDLNSKIPSVLAPQNIQAVVSGNGKDYGIIEHTKDDIENDLNNINSIIYTSGLGGLFKPGIPIGKISKDSKFMTANNWKRCADVCWNCRGRNVSDVFSAKPQRFEHLEFDNI